MRQCDVMIFPSLEEGCPLVCNEALASGCVPLVANAHPDACVHLENSLVHEAGDVMQLYKHITMLYQRPDLLGKLRENAIRSGLSITWKDAGKRLVEVYEQAAGKKLAKKACV
jgi:glycosyltransferase involved in cell wall biosynthesis